MLDRRHLMLGAAGSVACAVAAGTTLAANSVPPGPPLPLRNWNNSNPTVPYPDPNVQVLDPRFKKYIAGATLLRRIWAAPERMNGPVWFGDMNSVIFSDIPNNRLLNSDPITGCYDTITGCTTTFRSPS